jgi:DNA-binding PadR family transcriptional regulator
MSASPREVLPLKDLVFRILVTLAEGERHGADLARALEDSTSGPRVLPGHFYRTIDRMLDDGLIAESDSPSSPPPPRTARGAAPTRFFQLTPFGRAVARAETDRLAALIDRSRAARLLRGRR